MQSTWCVTPKGRYFLSAEPADTTEKRVCARFEETSLRRSEQSLRSRIHLAVDELGNLDRELAQILLLMDRDVILRETTRLLTQGYGLHAAWIAEQDGHGDVEIKHASGTATEKFHGFTLHRGCGLGGKVWARGAVEWVDDYISSPAITHHYDDIVGGAGIQRMIAAPIMNGSQPLGVLLGGLRDEGTFGNRAAKIVETVADRTAHALLIAERARHVSEVAVHEERQRMALDLHDTIGAMLFAISAGVRSVSEQATNVDADLQKRLLAIEQQAGQAAVTLRESLRALSTSAEVLALGAALQASCRKFEERSGVKAQLIMLDVLQPLPAGRVKALIAATKEGLLNVEKHAHANRVVVTAASMREGVAVTVTDDGVGFPAHAPDHHGFGLEAIAEALKQVGGHLKLSEDGDGGVSFRAWVPY